MIPTASARRARRAERRDRSAHGVRPGWQALGAPPAPRPNPHTAGRVHSAQSFCTSFRTARVAARARLPRLLLGAARVPGRPGNIARARPTRSVRARRATVAVLHSAHRAAAAACTTCRHLSTTRSTSGDSHPARRVLHALALTPAPSTLAAGRSAAMESRGDERRAVRRPPLSASHGCARAEGLTSTLLLARRLGAGLDAR